MSSYIIFEKSRVPREDRGEYRLIFHSNYDYISNPEYKVIRIFIISSSFVPPAIFTSFVSVLRRLNFTKPIRSTDSIIYYPHDPRMINFITTTNIKEIERLYFYLCSSCTKIGISKNKPLLKKLKNLYKIKYGSYPNVDQMLMLKKELLKELGPGLLNEYLLKSWLTTKFGFKNYSLYLYETEKL